MAIGCWLLAWQHACYFQLINSFPKDRETNWNMEGGRLEVVEKVASGMGIGESSQKQVEHRNIIFKMIDKMLTIKKFKNFLNKNIAAL